MSGDYWSRRAELWWNEAKRPAIRAYAGLPGYICFNSVVDCAYREHMPIIYSLRNAQILGKIGDIKESLESSAT
jgi:hypothetical protein